MTRGWSVLLVTVLCGLLPVQVLAEERQVDVKLAKTVETKASSGGAFGPDGKVYVVQISSDELQVYDTATGKLIVKKPAHRRRTDSAFPLFSPDGAVFAYIGIHELSQRESDDFISLWDTKTWMQSAVLRTPYPQRLVFSPDSRTLVVETGRFSTSYGPIPLAHIWDVKGGKERAVFKSGGNSVAYSPDGKLLFLGGGFLNTATEEWIEFPGGRKMPEGSSAREAVFSQDSGSFSGVVQESGKPAVRKCWDLKTGKEIDLNGFRAAAKVTEKAALSPDGRTIVREGTSVRDKERGEKEFVKVLALVDFTSEKSLAVIEHAYFPAMFGKDGKTLIGFSKGGFTTWELTWKDTPGK